MSRRIEYVLTDESATIEMGKRLAEVCCVPAVIFLKGQLGAGKTTLVRGLLQGLGVSGSVKSPTFTLVEPYQLTDCRVFHFDLYRLNDPEELEHIGLRDYFAEDSICLIEWPEKGQPKLPLPDLSCELNLDAAGRVVDLQAYSARGEAILGKLATK